VGKKFLKKTQFRGREKNPKAESDGLYIISYDFRIEKEGGGRLGGGTKRV